MKRIKNSDINFKLNPKLIYIENFSMKFYTVNSASFFIGKNQDDVFSVEREATPYDDPEVIISGGTKVTEYFIKLDWLQLKNIGEGVLNYRCLNNVFDTGFDDTWYNRMVEQSTEYYIDSDYHIKPEDEKNIAEQLEELDNRITIEAGDREMADTFISGAVDTEIARAISADTELSERIDELASGTSEALDNEIARAISAETALQDAIDAEEARAIAIENAIRQDLTDESEIRSSADTAMWTAINDEIARSTSAETALDNKIDVENLRAIGVENAISGNLETYKATANAALQAETTRATSAETKIATDLSNYIASNNHALADEVSRATSAETALNNALTAETAARESEVTRATAAENAISGIVDNYITTNNAAVQAEITRATSAETALQDAIGDETTARANADAALGTRIDNISSASTAAIEAEEARAMEAESGLATALQNEVTRATSAETQLSNSLTAEINRATSAETAIDNKIDAETLRAIGVENTISGNLETYKATANAALQAETTRATSAETALQTAINDEVTARANADTALQTAITNEVSRAREAESGITNSLNAEVTRATGAENALDDKIDAETTRATGAEAALDVKIGTVSGNVISETTRAITTENALSGAIDTLDVRFFDNAKYENSGNTKVINFYNAGVVKATIDATDFIKDGMISTVELVQSGTTSVLVITWNTDAGSQVTTIDVGDIFEADNYYDKTAIDGIVSGINTSIADEISARTDADTALSNRIAAEASARTDADTAINVKIDALSGAIDTKLAISDFNTYSGNVNTAINGKLAISDFNTYSGAVDTLINSKASQSTVDALNGVVTAHTSDSTIHVTSSDKEKWNKVDDKAYTTALTAVNDALTAHTADSVAHITAAERTAWNAKADESAFTVHTSDSTIHLTSGNVQSQIDNSISGKANSSDVYLKSETSGATELATAFAEKQNQLVAGENITISGNVISSEGGGCEVEETVVYDRITGGYVDDGDSTKASFVILDYLGDKSTGNYQLAFIVGDTFNNYVNAYINFDYPNHSSSSTDTGITEYLTVEYVNDIQDFKVTIKPVYQSSVWIKQVYNVGTDMNLLVPFYTINSGSPCTVITTDVVGLSTKIKNIADKSVSYVYLNSGKDNLGLNYGRHNGLGGSSDIRLEELDGSNNVLKPNIQVSLGTSGWTEFSLEGNTCQFGDYTKLGFTAFRISGDTTDLGSWYLQISAGYEDSYYEWDNLQWVDNENTFIRTTNRSEDVFSATTVDWDSNTGYLTVSYPQTINYNGQTKQTTLNCLYSNNCQFGYSITKLEGYTEQTQPIKPYVQQLRTDVNTISGQVATKQDTLVSSENIKTINNESILGGGNIDIQGGSDINVVQTTGTSTADVMSQDAVTTQFNNKANKTAAVGGYGFGSSSDGDYIQYKSVNNSNIGNSIYYPKINGKGILTSNNIYAKNNYNFELVETSAITTSVTSASTDSQIPSAKAVYDALGSASGGITSGEVQTMIDQSISGKTNQSDFTGHTADTTIHVTSSDKTSWNGAVTDIATVSGQVSTNTTNIATVSAATASNTTALGGLSLVKLTQSEYDALVTKDNNTLYVIVG